MSHSDGTDNDAEHKKRLDPINKEVLGYLLREMFGFAKLLEELNTISDSDPFFSDNPLTKMLVERLKQRHDAMLENFSEVMIKSGCSADNLAKMMEYIKPDKDKQKPTREQSESFIDENEIDLNFIPGFMKALLSGENGFRANFIGFANACNDMRYLADLDDPMEKRLMGAMPDFKSSTSNPFSVAFQVAGKFGLFVIEYVKVYELFNQQYESETATADAKYIAHHVVTRSDYEAKFKFNLPAFLSLKAAAGKNIPSYISALDLCNQYFDLSKVIDDLIMYKVWPNEADQTKLVQFLRLNYFYDSQPEKLAALPQELQTILRNMQPGVEELKKQLGVADDSSTTSSVPTEQQSAFGKKYEVYMLKLNAGTPQELSPAQMEYNINRYLYSFSPPKKPITYTQAKQLLDYLGANPTTALTKNSVIVLQNFKQPRWPASKSLKSYKKHKNIANGLNLKEACDDLRGLSLPRGERASEEQLFEKFTRDSLADALEPLGTIPPRPESTRTGLPPPPPIPKESPRASSSTRPEYTGRSLNDLLDSSSVSSQPPRGFYDDLTPHSDILLPMLSEILDSSVVLPNATTGLNRDIDLFLTACSAYFADSGAPSTQSASQLKDTFDAVLAPINRAIENSVSVSDQESDITIRSLKSTASEQLAEFARNHFESRDPSVIISAETIHSAVRDQRIKLAKEILNLSLAPTESGGGGYCGDLSIIQALRDAIRNDATLLSRMPELLQTILDPNGKKVGVISEEDAKAFRRLYVEYLTSQSVNQERVNTVGAAAPVYWLTDVDMTAIAKWLKINLNVVQLVNRREGDPHDAYQFKPDGDSVATINIYNKGNYHYQALLAKPVAPDLSKAAQKIGPPPPLPTAPPMKVKELLAKYLGMVMSRDSDEIIAKEMSKDHFDKTHPELYALFSKTAPPPGFTSALDTRVKAQQDALIAAAKELNSPPSPSKPLPPVQQVTPTGLQTLRARLFGRGRKEPAPEPRIPNHIFLEPPAAVDSELHPPPGLDEPATVPTELVVRQTPRPTIKGSFVAIVRTMLDTPEKQGKLGFKSRDVSKTEGTLEISNLEDEHVATITDPKKADPPGTLGTITATAVTDDATYEAMKVTLKLIDNMPDKANSIYPITVRHVTTREQVIGLTKALFEFCTEKNKSPLNDELIKELGDIHINKADAAAFKLALYKLLQDIPDNVYPSEGDAAKNGNYKAFIKHLLTTEPPPSIPVSLKYPPPELKPQPLLGLLHGYEPPKSLTQRLFGSKKPHNS